MTDRTRNTMEDVVQWLNSLGYVGAYDGQDEATRSYYIYDKDRTGLRIAVFSEKLQHPRLGGGKIAAETNQTFNKWTQAYLIREYPTTQEEFDLLKSDLDLIRKPIHIERANEFLDFDRNPPKAKDRQRYRNRPARK